MAECLVLDKGHFWDDGAVYAQDHLRIDNHPSWTAEKKIAKKLILTRKYNARYQRGDFTGEIHEDGFWTDGRRKGWGNAKGLVLVVIPNLAAATLRQFVQKVVSMEIDPESGLEVAKIIKRSRFQLPATIMDAAVDGKITVNNVQALSLIDKEVP